MSTLVMARSKAKAEKVEEIEAGIKRLVAELERSQREDMRYEWFRFPDGATYMILTEFGDSVAQSHISGYTKFDEKPIVEKLTVSRSYRVF